MIPLVIIAENREELSKLVDEYQGSRRLIIINDKREDSSLLLYLRQLESCGIEVLSASERVNSDNARKIIKEFCKIEDFEVLYDNKIIPVTTSQFKEIKTEILREFPYPFTDEQRSSKGIKLHLGCGSLHLNDFINIDIDNPVADENIDASNLKKYKDNSVSLILASHIIEHFDWRQHERILKEWYRVLMPDCWLIIEAPNLEESCKNFLEEKDDGKRLYLVFPQIFGRPDFSVGNIHLSGVWPSYLKNALKTIGFKKLVTMPPIRNEIQHRCLRIDALK